MAERPPSAYEGDEPYVFVSHSHGDRAVVYAEIRWLQAQGIHVWYDTGISVGSEWSEALARAIKGANHFVYFVTPRSVNSENCRRELNFALEEQSSILAVHLEPTDVPDGIRLNLNNRQALFRYSDSNYQQNLVRALGGKQSDSIEPTRHIAGTRMSITRRPLAAALAIAILLCVAVISWYFKPSLDAGDKSIAVLPFSNRSAIAEDV